MTDTLAFDLTSLHRFYTHGGRPEDVVDLAFERLEAANDPGIFIHLTHREALKDAARALGVFDPVAKPLWGVPCAIKDNIDATEAPTTAACPDYAYTPRADATVVKLLRAAGALIVGKTNLDQFATGLVGVRTPYPVPNNAIDPALVPGGSSSGSAVATSRGIVSFALGTDTAGSGRIPAGLNNIVGLKPSFGALSTTGVVPACRTLDCVSIFALTVEDAYKVFRVVAKPDATDDFSRAFHVSDLAEPSALTIGVPAVADRRFFGDAIMEAAYAAALEQLERLGHRLVELPFADFFKVADLVYEGAWVAERYAAVRAFFDTHADSFYPVTRKIFGGAKALSAADAFDGLYALQGLKKRVAPLIASVDMLCVPTAPRHFTRAELEAEPIRENSRLGTYTNFVNLLDLCGVAVPSGSRSDGWPASVTLLASAGNDALTAGVAAALHRASKLKLGATDWPIPSAATPSAANSGEDTESVDLVVVGAHLTGMPLNHQLLESGARLVARMRTTASYRLFALEGQTPQKPGLKRVAEGEGYAIEVEIWRLATEAFGRFVSRVPAPLAIGAVELEDGRVAKGFLAEPIAFETGEDISTYGGWRAFIGGG